MSFGGKNDLYSQFLEHDYEMQSDSNEKKKKRSSFFFLKAIGLTLVLVLSSAALVSMSQESNQTNAATQTQFKPQVYLSNLRNENSAAAVSTTATSSSGSFDDDLSGLSNDEATAAVIAQSETETVTVDGSSSDESKLLQSAKTTSVQHSTSLLKSEKNVLSSSVNNGDVAKNQLISNPYVAIYFSPGSSLKQSSSQTDTMKISPEPQQTETVVLGVVAPVALLGQSKSTKATSAVPVPPQTGNSETDSSALHSQHKNNGVEKPLSQAESNQYEQATSASAPHHKNIAEAQLMSDPYIPYYFSENGDLMPLYVMVNPIRMAPEPKATKAVILGDPVSVTPY